MENNGNGSCPEPFCPCGDWSKCDPLRMEREEKTRLSSYNKNNGNGCKQRKCPCRLWINCHTYTDMQRQIWKLKHKDCDFNEEWYKTNFRHPFGMPDIVING